MTRNNCKQIWLSGAAITVMGLLAACNNTHTETAKANVAKTDSASIFLLQKQTLYYIILSSSYTGKTVL